MKQTRYNVFETNSSSTHNLVMCSENEFKDFEAGKTYYCRWEVRDRNKNVVIFEEGKFYPKDEVESYYESLGKSMEDAYDMETYEYIMDNDYLESFEETYTTPNGDVVYAFGNFGYDG